MQFGAVQLGLWGSHGCESDCIGFLGAFWIPRNPNPSSASSCITLVGLHITPFQFFLIQDSVHFLSYLQIPLSKLVASEQDGTRNCWLSCLSTWSTESCINQCVVCPWLALLRAEECMQDGWRHIQLRPVFFFRYLIISWNFSRWKYFFVHLSFLFSSMTFIRCICEKCSYFELCFSLLSFQNSSSYQTLSGIRVYV